MVGSAIHPKFAGVNLSEFYSLNIKRMTYKQILISLFAACTLFASCSEEEKDEHECAHPLLHKIFVRVDDNTKRIYFWETWVQFLDGSSSEGYGYTYNHHPTVLIHYYQTTDEGVIDRQWPITIGENTLKFKDKEGNIVIYEEKANPKNEYTYYYD